MGRVFENRKGLGLDNTIRKAHYGEDRYAWDDIVEKGWAPEFCAGCILRYLRRSEDVEHSVESAQWYFKRLKEFSENKDYCRHDAAVIVFNELNDMLTHSEFTILTRLSNF